MSPSWLRTSTVGMRPSKASVRANPRSTGRLPPADNVRRGVFFQAPPKTYVDVTHASFSTSARVANILTFSRCISKKTTCHWFIINQTGYNLVTFSDRYVWICGHPSKFRMMSLVDPNIVATNGGNQLMDNCRFGTRWFGFLGFHKGKGLLLRGTPRKKTAINHRLRPESGKKKQCPWGQGGTPNKNHP